MRIGVDIRPLLDRPLSGVGEYTLRLLSALLQQDNDDTFVFFANAFHGDVVLPKEWPSDRYMVRRFSIPNKLFNGAVRLVRTPKLDRLLGGVDCFFAPNIHFLAVSPATPLVLTVHDLSFFHYPELLSAKRRLWHQLVSPRRLIEESSGVIAVSHATAHDLQRTFRVPGGHLFVVQSGIDPHTVTAEDLGRVRAAHHLPDRFVFSLSTLEPRKNLVTLLDAYTLLRRDFGYDGSLVIAGAQGWSMGQFARIVADHPYRRDIHMLDYITDDDKHALYRLADAFLYLSLFEGFGFPPLEALLQGTPVVAGHHSSITEIVGDAALLVDVHNVREVAAATAQLLEDRSLRKELARSQGDLVQRYSWDRAAAETRDVFTAVQQRFSDRH